MRGACRHVPVGQRAGRVLLEIEHAAGDALALVGREVRGGVGDVVRREQAAERPRRDRLLEPVLALALLLALDALLPFGQRPADVDLVDADAVAVEQRRGVPRQRHQRRPSTPSRRRASARRRRRSIDPMLTIEPPPRAFIGAIASCSRMNGARRLTAMIASQRATGDVLEVAARRRRRRC